MNDLRHDSDYQRPLDKKRLEELAASFDFEIAEQIRAGEIIVNGQHRWLAHQRREEEKLRETPETPEPETPEPETPDDPEAS